MAWKRCRYSGDLKGQWSFDGHEVHEEHEVGTERSILERFEETFASHTAITQSAMNFKWRHETQIPRRILHFGGIYLSLAK